MNAAPIWTASWANRIEARLRNAGYESMTDLLAAMPAKPYAIIAARLGEDVAPIQVLSLQYREARASHAMRSAAKDSLVRAIVDAFPQGWGTGDNAEWRATKALAGWIAEILVTGESPELESVLNRVARELTQLRPDLGWLPEDPNDALIKRAFEGAWPEGR